MSQQPCPNLNHRRTTITIRYCPHCGDVLNARIAVAPCREEHHAQQRQHSHLLRGLGQPAPYVEGYPLPLLLASPGVSPRRSPWPLLA